MSNMRDPNKLHHDHNQSKLGRSKKHVITSESMTIQQEIGSLWVNIVLNIVKTKKSNAMVCISSLVNKFSDMIDNGGNLVRASCVCWLMNIAKFVAFKHDRDLGNSNVNQIQQILTKSCKDKNKFTADCASQGLSYCFANELDYIEYMIEHVIYQKLDSVVADLVSLNILSEAVATTEPTERTIEKIKDIDPNIWYYLCVKNDNKEYFEVIKWLLKHGTHDDDFSVNKIFFPNSLKETTLILASKTGNIQFIKLLIENGFDLSKLMNYCSKNDGRSAFLNLCYFGYADCLKFIINVVHGDLVSNARETKNDEKKDDASQPRTALHKIWSCVDKEHTNCLLAAIDGYNGPNLATARYLVNNAPIDVLNACDSNENNVFHYLCYRKDTNSNMKTGLQLFKLLVNRLLKEKQNNVLTQMINGINNNGETICHVACQTNNISILGYLVTNRIGLKNVNKQEYTNNNTPLMVAIYNNNVKCVNTLCSCPKNVDIINASNNNKQSSFELAAALTSSKILPTSTILSILIVTMVKQTKHKQLKVNFGKSKNISLFVHECAKLVSLPMQMIEACKILLHYSNLGYNGFDSNGNKPIHLTVLHNNDSFLNQMRITGSKSLLVYSNPNALTRDNNGETAMMIAVRKQHLECLESLCKLKGIDILNIRDKKHQLNCIEYSIYYAPSIFGTDDDSNETIFLKRMIQYLIKEYNIHYATDFNKHKIFNKQMITKLIQFCKKSKKQSNGCLQLLDKMDMVMTTSSDEKKFEKICKLISYNNVYNSVAELLLSAKRELQGGDNKETLDNERLVQFVTTNDLESFKNDFTNNNKIISDNTCVEVLLCILRLDLPRLPFIDVMIKHGVKLNCFCF